MPSPPPSRDLQIRLPMPHQGQRTFFRGRKRFNFLDAGRRWRKTTGFVILTVEDLLDGQQVFWGAPTFDQVRVGWNEMKKATAGVFHFNQSQMRVDAPGGGYAVFRSLDDPDNARGHTASRVRLDESADINPVAWYEVLRPMLIDTQGTLDAGGTPKGKNWFWDEWWRAHLGDAADSAAWQAPTLGARIEQGQLIRAPHPMENPDIPWAEIENIFATIPERVFRQEILAEFLESAGGVFENVRATVRGALEAGPRHPQTRYVMGVDLAKHQDYTVVVVMDVVERRVVYFKRFNQAPYDVQKQQIYIIAKFWNNAAIWIDSTPGSVGDPIFDDLQRSGLDINPYPFTHASKTALINNAVLLVEQRQVGIPAACDILIEELGSYEYKVSAAGNYQMNAPSGKHDDCVIAFALACWSMSHMTMTPLNQWYEEIQIQRGPQDSTTFGGNALLDKRF